MTISITADQAFERYESFFKADALVQGNWHGRDDDGRELACGLGALDPEINNPRDCPASVMPRWLAQMVPWFFDNQEAADAKLWGLNFYAELKRLGGNVPFSVVHDWQATVVGPLAIQTARDQKRDVAAHEALLDMQIAAAGGKKFSADEWRPTLKAAFLDIYKYRYRAYANADADAYANAYANADANADANAYAYADADAYANASYRARIKALADGMVECLKRVEVQS